MADHGGPPRSPPSTSTHRNGDGSTPPYEFVFGSFGEGEVDYYQLPAEQQAQAQPPAAAPLLQFGDVTAELDHLPVSDEAPNGAATVPLLPRLQVGSVPAEAVESAEEAAAVPKTPTTNGRDEAQAQAAVNGQAKQQQQQQQQQPQAPKSWASLVGVQPGGGSRSPGQVKSAPVPAAASKPAAATSAKIQPRGLINTGNSCFANATLQGLLSCPPFLNLLASIKSRTIPETGFPALGAFANFAAQFKSTTEPDLKDQKPGPVDVGKPFAPVMFDDVLRSFSPDQPSRGRPRQEDAQEFLSHVMDRLHEELLRLEGRSVAGQNAVVDDNDEWETVGPKNRSALTRTHMAIKSPLSEIFGGELYSIVKAKGNRASATVQPFLVLHLDILPEPVQSLEDALKFFASPESLEGYKAASSKPSEVVSASKAIKIQSLPPVLIVHFMRFSYGASGSGKLNKPVKYSNTLTIGRELLSSTTGLASEGRKYELVATVTHHGKDPSAGHYTADCRQADGRWLRFDDDKVAVVPINRVLQEQAYVLFYKRVTQ